MTNRLDTLIDALAHQAEHAWTQLENTRNRLHMLEAENRSLKARLEILESPGAAGPAQQEQQAGQAAGDEHETGILTGQAQEPETGAVNETADNRDVTAPSPQVLLNQWYQRYPKTFFKGHTRPLQVGIHEQLAVHEPWPDKLIKRALAGYVNLPRYLKSVRAGTLRVDLDGRETEPVTETDAQHAREQLKLLQQRQRERDALKTSQRMAQKLSQLTSKHKH